MSMFDGICGKVAPGLCRLSVNGGIAVKTRSGYRAYDAEKKRLTNCDSFVLDVGEDFFFVMPTNRVRPGDIILSGGRPYCVLSEADGAISAISYEDAAMVTLLPEHHMFMGSSYLYGRIVSLFGKNGAQGKRGAGRMIRYMMLSALMRNREGGTGNLLPLLLLGGKGDLMDELFEDEQDDDPEEKEA